MILCSGNCVCGPSDGSRTLIFSSMLIAIPSVLYLAFPGVALVKLSIAFPVVGAIFMVTSLTFLFLAAATDPGILPRALKDEASSDIYFPILHDFEVDGVVHRLKYCSSCHIYRSLRASHCSDCDNCVLDFDHHCPWVGTCIARRNYKYFVLFIYSSTTLCLYVFSTSIVQLMLANVRPIPPDEQGSNVMEDFKWQPMSFFLIVYTFIIAWSIGSLTVFHCILMCQGKTTREFIKKTSEGPVQNNSCGARCSEVFCTPTPSYIESLKRGCAHDGSDICHGDGLYAQFRPFVVLSCNSALVKDQLRMQQGANDAVAGLLAQHDIHTASAASGSSREMECEGEELGAPGPSVITAGNAAPLGTFEPRVTVTDGNDMPASMSSATGIGPSADGDVDASQSSRASWRSMGSGSIHGSFKQKVVRPNRYKSPTFTSQPEGAPIEVSTCSCPCTSCLNVSLSLRSAMHDSPGPVSRKCVASPSHLPFTIPKKKWPIFKKKPFFISCAT